MTTARQLLGLARRRAREAGLRRPAGAAVMREQVTFTIAAARTAHCAIASTSVAFVSPAG